MTKIPITVHPVKDVAAGKISQEAIQNIQYKSVGLAVKGSLCITSALQLMGRGRIPYTSEKEIGLIFSPTQN